MIARLRTGYDTAGGRRRKIIELTDLIGSPWFYGLLVLSITFDVFLPVLPSGSLVIAGTVYAQSTGRLNEVLILLCAAFASTLGDHLGYRVAAKGSGRFHRLLAKVPKAEKIDGRARATLTRHTLRTVVFARFIPTGRSMATLLAGTSHLPVLRFQRASALAALLWATYTVGLGYLNALLFNTAWVSVIVGIAAASAVGTILARASRRRVALGS